MSECPFSKASDIDFMDPEVQENWFAAYDLIREESPAYYMPQLGMYVLTRYDDIEYVLKRPLQFSSGQDVQETEPLIKYEASRKLYEETGWRRFTPLGENPPMHGNYRALVDPALTTSGFRVGSVKDFPGAVKGSLPEAI